jgi:cytochrome c biogenesis protein CcmG/thiol:disulfide interchange protein DsbE
VDEAPTTGEPVVSPPEPPPRRRLRWWILAGGFAVLTVAVIWKGAGSDGPLGTAAGGGRAPDFRLNRLDDPNRAVSLADFRGRPLVLNFWASWCVPCRKEMPAFESVATELTGRVEFLGVNEQDTRPGALDLVAKTGVRYPSVVDADGTLMTAYRLRGLPDTAFISPDGELLELHVGELNATELRATIRRLFDI